MNVYALARYRAGLGLTEAAEQAGVAARTISRLEGGEITKPSAPIVKALADAYQTTVDELLGLPEAA